MNTARRRIGFRVAAVFLGLLPIAIVEFGLRIAGVAVVRASQEAAKDGKGISLSAYDADPLVDLHSLRPLFVRSADGELMEIGSSRMNFFCPASFPAIKRPGTRRIFALGGSTTQGQPYLTETAFPKWLELRLQAALPDENIEVINVGGISYASYRVAAILDEVLQHSPDMIVLYTGHNEFLEARTYARERAIPRWLAAPVSVLEDLRIVQVSAKLWHRQANVAIKKTVMPSEVDTLLDHAEGMAAYVRDEVWTEGVHRHFESTLATMVRRCQEASVPLVLCVPASDLVNTPPFKSTPDPSLPIKQVANVEEWAKVIESDVALTDRKEAAASIFQLDPKHALANYAIGRWAFEADEGDLSKAIGHLVEARDHDVCALRATTRIVECVRSCGNRRGVYLLDTPALFDLRDASGRLISDGVADPSWFVDHVHPTIEGHQLIASRIYSLLVKANWFVPNVDAETMYGRLVEEHLGTLGEAYFGRAKQRLEGVNRWSRRIK